MNRFFIILLRASFTFAIVMTVSAEEKKSTSYALMFRDGHTTGSWMLAIDDGMTYEITDISKDSNQSAKDALWALHPEIIRLNTIENYNIYLVGEMKKSDTSGLKAGQMGQAEFRLDGWYIKAPFFLPPETDPDGMLRVSDVLTVANFLPAGERNDSEETRKLRSLLDINYDKRLNIFWFGVKHPIHKFLEKNGDK
jgi:hypothetical protein